MKKVTIYGKTYDVHPSCKKPPDLYWYNNNLTDEPLSGRTPAGYCKMEDNSIVAVYSKKPIVQIIATVAAVAVLICGVYYGYTLLSRPKQLAGTMVKIDNLNNNAIAFNSIIGCNGANADVRFTNGNSVSTIQVTGEGIESAPVEVKPNTNVSTIPMKITSKDEVIEATLSVTTAGSTYTYPILVEAYPNMNSMGGDHGDLDLSLTFEENPFEGEYIIGIQ